MLSCCCFLLTLQAQPLQPQAPLSSLQAAKSSSPKAKQPASVPNGMKPIHEEHSSPPRLDLPDSGEAEVVPFLQTPGAALAETMRAPRGKAPQSDSAGNNLE